jgi:hypothetical protein
MSQELIESGYLTEVHKFSKFIHGSCTLLPDMVQVGCFFLLVKEKGGEGIQLQMRVGCLWRLHPSAAAPAGVNAHLLSSCAAAGVVVPRGAGHPVCQSVHLSEGVKGAPSVGPFDCQRSLVCPCALQAVPYWVDDESVRPSMLMSAPAKKALPGL